jgi:hypothetical protein
MKLTDSKRSWVTQEFNKYARQIGIPTELMPDLMLTTREVKDMPIELTEGRRTSAYKHFGVCFVFACTIFINVRAHKTIAGIRDTIVHELVHYRFPYMPWNNGPLYRRIKNVIKGKTYPPMLRLEPMGDKFVPYDKDNKCGWHVGTTKQQIEAMTKEHRIARVQQSAKWLEKHNVRFDWILQELLDKYGKCISVADIEAGYNLFAKEKEGTESN